MRKGKVFTRALIQKWLDEKRGSGVFEDFTALHQVTRADPGSKGLSRIQNVNNSARPEHLLSDTEYGVYLFARMIPGLIDLREQFHLSQDDAKHELADYQISHDMRDFPGTLAVAKELGIKHSRIQNNPEAPWPFSTDLLLTLKFNNKLSLLAISIKPKGKLSKRTQQLIAIESMYWQKRDVQFLLITPATYLDSVINNMKTYSAWGHGMELDIGLLNQVELMSKELDGLPLFAAMKLVQDRLDLSYLNTQQVFWGSVWRGYLRIDLDRRATSGTAINILSKKAFWIQNPIASGRSAWPI